MQRSHVLPFDSGLSRPVRDPSLSPTSGSPAIGVVRRLRSRRSRAMRSLFVGMIALSASIAVVDAAQAQTHLQRLPSYSSMRAHIGHQRPAQYNLQPTQDDVEKINRDNRQLDLPASQDEITGAGQVQSEEDALTNRIRQDNPRSIVKSWTSAQAAGAPRMRRFISGRGQPETGSITRPPDMS
jgi:hypothetical protein